MAKKITPEQLRAAYKDEFSLRQAFEKNITEIIEKILYQHPYCSVDARTKTEDSFVAKVNRPGKRYKEPISEITDITGVRVIVEYKDEAEKAEQRLRETLIIDEKNSRDTRLEAPETEFGYSAIHLVASLPPDTADEHNLHAFKNRKFEIQIRTNLENAWATKSRELFYDRTVPTEYRRGLNRLAALLEIADESFLNLRNKVKNTPIKIRDKQTASQAMSTEDVLLILSSSKTLAEIVSRLATKGLKIIDSSRNEFAVNISDIFARQGVGDQQQAEVFLAKRADDIDRASELYMTATNMKSYPKDSLLVAALAIVDNGDITPEEYSKTWNERWKNGFLEASDAYRKTKIQSGQRPRQP